MELQTLPFGVGEIGGVAPFHAQERTSSTYPPHFSKQSLERLSGKSETDSIVELHRGAERGENPYLAVLRWQKLPLLSPPTTFQTVSRRHILGN